MGNPLLDISINVEDDALLKKYGLQLGEKTRANEGTSSLYDEIWCMKGRKATPGGAAMNTARAANCMLKHRGNCGKVTFFGAIGMDQKAQYIEREAYIEGLNANF
jgi:sugar/nucleoside kinase (ribokinase family)